MARSTTLKSGLTPLLTLPGAAPSHPLHSPYPSLKGLVGQGAGAPDPDQLDLTRRSSSSQHPREAANTPMALPSFHRQAPLESTLSGALGKAGTGTSPFCVGGLEIRSAAAHGLRDPEMTQRPDAHPGSDRSRRALSWRSSVGSESLCFFCPHGRLLDKSQVHTLGSWEGLKSPYHPLPSSSPLTLSLLGCLVHHWPHHQQGTFPEHLLGSVCSGHGHLAPQTGQCKQLK